MRFPPSREENIETVRRWWLAQLAQAEQAAGPHQSGSQTNAGLKIPRFINGAMVGFICGFLFAVAAAGVHMYQFSLTCVR